MSHCQSLKKIPVFKKKSLIYLNSQTDIHRHTDGQSHNFHAILQFLHGNYSALHAGRNRVQP